MSTTEQTRVSNGSEEARCPIDHKALSYQKTARKTEAKTVPLECDAQGVWQVYGFEEARMLLRNNSATKQAGFKAEMMEHIPGVTNHPILFLEGKEHQQQRKQTARFFTPKTVSSNYRQFMEKLADQLVAEVKQKKRTDLSQLSLGLAVQVAARVVGVMDSLLPGMDKRLDSFFHQQGTPHQASGPQTVKNRLFRSKFFTALQQLTNQRQMLAFYWLDVRPAIRKRRRQPQEDIISHLLSKNYSEAEILTECVTFAAAGMVTTREFISVAAWHLLEQPELRQRYLAAEEEERFEILHETLRIEPIVGNLLRRATSDITLKSQGKEVTIPSGSLINIHIYAANADEAIVGEEPLALCPMRPLSDDRVASMLLSFGDGHHRCPGAYIAIQETDIFLQRLLALDGLHIEKLPTVEWNELTTGYEIRDFLLALN